MRNICVQSWDSKDDIKAAVAHLFIASILFMTG